MMRFPWVEALMQCLFPVPNSFDFHVVKAWPQYFQKLKANVKTAEIRRNDRNYKIGDLLIVVEWDPVTQGYTRADQIRYLISDITTGMGLSDGYVMLSLKSV